MSVKKLLLSGAFVLFFILLISMVSAEVNYALDENGGTASYNVFGGHYYSYNTARNINDNNEDTYVGFLNHDNDFCMDFATYEAQINFDEPRDINIIQAMTYTYSEYSAPGFFSEWNEFEKISVYYPGTGWVQVYSALASKGLNTRTPSSGPWNGITAVKLSFKMMSCGGSFAGSSPRYHRTNELRAWGEEIIPEPPEPECCVDGDCGRDYYGNKYCSGRNVYRKFYDFSCEDGECKERVLTRLFERCDYDCENGRCIEEPEPPEPECCNDEDCNDDYYEDEYCSMGDVYKKFHDFSCEDRECEEEIVNELVEECDYDCVGGECVEEPEEPICSFNSDCGTDHCLGEANYCFEENVYQDFVVYTCNNPGELDSYCSDNTLPWLLEECLYGCENGECIDEPEPPEFVCGNDILEPEEECDDGNTDDGDGCSSICEIEEPLECCADEDCSEDYYSDKYCVSDDIYEDFYDFSCVDDKCVEIIVNKLVEGCEFGCEDGECKRERKRVSSHDDSCDSRHEDCGYYDEEVLKFYDESVGDIKIDEAVLIGQSSLTGEVGDEVRDDSWIIYLFIGCIGLLVLILIVLSVRK